MQFGICQGLIVNTSVHKSRGARVGRAEPGIYDYSRVLDKAVDFYLGLMFHVKQSTRIFKCRGPFITTRRRGKPLNVGPRPFPPGTIARQGKGIGGRSEAVSPLRNGEYQDHCVSPRS